MINKIILFSIVYLIATNIFLFAHAENKIVKAENWLNNIDTMTADFIQVSSDGRSAEGKLYLKKGKGFRFEYNPPSHLLIVGRGNLIIIQDLKNKTSTNYPLFNTPFSKFLTGDVSFTKNQFLTSYKKKTGILKIKIESRKEDEGLIELEFSSEPFLLRKWRIIDKIGTEVTITLQNHVFGLNLPNKTFRGFAFPAPDNEN